MFWGLFIIVPAVTAIAGAVTKATGAGKVAVVGGTTMLALNNKAGYRPGEGVLSVRAYGESFSITFDKESDRQLCSSLGFLAELLPEEFKDVSKYDYDITVTEVDQLSLMIHPTRHAVEVAFALREQYMETGEEMLKDATIQAFDNLRDTAMPIKQWLKDLPPLRKRLAV